MKKWAVGALLAGILVFSLGTASIVL